VSVTKLEYIPAHDDLEAFNYGLGRKVFCQFVVAGKVSNDIKRVVCVYVGIHRHCITGEESRVGWQRGQGL
jgi:hypothetical protein